MALAKLVAVVPVRKGSQRVKNKNLKKFSDTNLLTFKIETLKKVKRIDNIVINTDSEEAIEIAKKLNVDYKIREDYFASSECTNSEFWSHIAEQTKSEFIIFTNCTSPLIKVETYNEIIDSFDISFPEHDSVNTVSEMKEYLYLDEKPLNFDPNKAPNSQDLPNVIKLNFAVNILKKETMQKKKSLVGYKPSFYSLNDVESLDINTKYEFEYAEFLYDKYYRKN
jgi:CMP-N-acetylneuraminic acid synthetase|tara:strand:+ start:42 stop:713 length:672 start_codon:yes stop_codon:yes gene_type:complete